MIALYCTLESVAGEAMIGLDTRSVDWVYCFQECGQLYNQKWFVPLVQQPYRAECCDSRTVSMILFLWILQIIPLVVIEPFGHFEEDQDEQKGEMASDQEP